MKGGGDAAPFPPEDEESDHGEWIIDLEIAMVKAFAWSLRDMDETDIETLLPFVFRWTATEAGDDKKAVQARRVYCDQVNWL